MATEVHSIPAPPTLLERRSGSRLQLLSDHPTSNFADAHAQNNDEATRTARGSLSSPFTFTPLTPILASPALTPAISTSTPSTSSLNLSPGAVPSNLIQNTGGGIQHKRSRSTLSRLHVTLPEDYFDVQNRVRSTTGPVSSPGPEQPVGFLHTSSLLEGLIIVNGIPIITTPPPADETVLQRVDFPAVPSRVSVATKPPRPRTKPVRKAFTLGSDGEDEVSGQQQKREVTAEVKKLEKCDDLRRYHVLMELLKTEAKYLQDLRILTDVYLQQLRHAVTSRSVASYFGASSSSSKQFPSPSPSVLSSAHAQEQPTTAPPSPVHSPSAIRRKSVGDRVDIERDSQFTRPIFTEEDMQLICRNSDEILAFHERFVDDLKEALVPLGSKFRFDTEDEYAYVDMPRHDTLELAIQIIVSMFVDRAQSFKLYKSFCSTHSEAVELIQRTRRAYPADWEAWEKRCRKHVLDNRRSDSMPVPRTSNVVQFELDGDPGPVPRESLGTNATVKTNRSSSLTLPKPSRANTAPPHLVSRQNHHGHSKPPRLGFLDQMIKPIQRICKYHLLLDQLKSRVPNHAHSQAWPKGGLDYSYPNPGVDMDVTFDSAELFSAGQTESLVSRACEAMREVVNSVNDDRRKHEDRWKSLLIASRTVPSSTSSPSSSLHLQLTSEFLVALGNCSVSGALDIIYHRPTTSTMTKAKYLGAFLYEQGYLVLVKVGKGKTYEPQHWFHLKDFDTLDLSDEDGAFPYSFHLTGNGHHFQLAAACQKEKEVWMECLRKAITAAAESEKPDLPSSLLDENREEVAPAPSGPVHDVLTEAPPIIQSETEHLEDLPAFRPGLTKVVSESKALSDDSHSTRTDPNSHSQPVSRRGSSNSVRAIFSPFLFDSGVRLVRPTVVQRHHTDQGLLDVFSGSCRDARNLAELQNQELFQLPRLIARSKSSATASGLRGRKDNRMFNRRSYCGPAAPSLSSHSASSTTATEKKIKQKRERPSSVMAFTRSWLEEDPSLYPPSALRPSSLAILSPEEDQPQSPPPDVTVSPCSSEMTSNMGLVISHPARLKTSSPRVHTGTGQGPSGNDPGTDGDYRPKRSKSMVDNVKSFFSSPYKRPSRNSSAGTELLASTLSLTRERTRSSPTSYPHDPFGSTLPSVSVNPADIDADTPASERPLPSQGKDGALGRKRSLFGYGRQHGTDISRLSAVSAVSATSSVTATSGSSPPVRRRSVKDILLHFRDC